MRITRDISKLCEWCGRWSEGCPCPHHAEHRRIWSESSPAEKRLIPQPQCIYKSCRGAELASGECLQGLQREAAEVMPRIQQYVSEASSPQLGAQLAGEWDRAVTATVATMVAKLHYFQELPHLLLGLAHRDPGVASRLH